MSNKRRKVLGQAPSKEQQQQADAIRRKKEFLRSMMKAQRLVVYVGGGQVSHWGFPANGDFLLFLLQEVYGWDGTNETFQRILANLQGRQQAEPSQEDKELDSLMAEVEQEGGAGSTDELQGEEGEEGEQDNAEAGEGQNEAPTPSNVVPMQPLTTVEKFEGSKVDGGAAARLAQLAKLRAEMAALEAMTK